MSYDTQQIAFKVLITVLLVAGAATAVVLSIFKVRAIWSADVDVSRLVEQPLAVAEKAANKVLDLVPTREPDGVYQGGNVVARFEGLHEPHSNRVLKIDELNRASKLDVDKPFEVGKWRVRIKHIEEQIGMLAGAPEKGMIYRNVTCEVLGTR